ncbi:hypothetical protein EXIGLDRAFT_739466 [Exidia glandulosa HHB12029]|uniref:Uncharacterized protein n=1 Tax=Exidia glandulosa HHB12029 TaxID=1314781 RepID=A0A165KSB9_EXIGL|nr:hypothetical protein EXIGLDRAFT_739466 [Exidia glandulosa HHB12029]
MSRFARYTARLQALSARTGTPLPSLITSFAVLHELTAVLPLVGLFFGARSLDVGPRAVQLVRDKTGDTEARGAEESWALQKTNQWLAEGEAWAGRVGRRYGYFGYEKGAPPEPLPEGAAVGGKLAGDVANAVFAYAATKALLPARIGLSLYLSPSFSRGVVEPLRRGVVRLFRR